MPGLRKIADLSAEGIFILLVIASGAGILGWQEQVKREKIEAVLIQGYSEVHLAYRAILDQYRSVTQEIVRHALTPEVISEVARGVLTDNEETKRIARGAVYRTLRPLFQRLQTQGFGHLTFHSFDGVVFLRMHEPTTAGDRSVDFRPLIRHALATRVRSEAFESGKFAAAFRFVEPLFYEGSFLGVVELAVSFRQLQVALNRIDGMRDYRLYLFRGRSAKIMPRELLLSEPSPLHPDLHGENYRLGLPTLSSPPPLWVSEVEHALSRRPNIRRAIEEVRTFYDVAILGHQAVIAVGIPIWNIEGEAEGFLLSYHPHPFIASIERETQFIKVGVIGVTALIVTLLLFLAMRRRREAEERAQLAAIMEALPTGFYQEDEGRRVVRVNHEFSKLLGFSIDEVRGQDAHRLFHVPISGVESDRCPIHDAVKIGKGFSGETCFVNKTGEKIPVTVRAVPIMVEGYRRGAITLFQDDRPRLAAEEEVRRLAWEDPLTGLPNRARARQHIDFLVRTLKGQSGCFALFLIGIDRFKQINETFGHEAGDAILKARAKTLQAFAETRHGFVARMGGDEFLLWLEISVPDIGKENHEEKDVDLRNENSEPTKEAEEIAEKICALFSESLKIDGRRIETTASVGLVIFPQQGQEAAELLRRADVALTYAKREGRATWVFYNDEIESRTRERFQLEQELRVAVRQGDFSLVYQPKYDLSTMRPTGVEALIRWKSPNLGFVPPDRFIALAEELGIVHEITRWVLRTVAGQISRWEKEGLKIPVAVNLSAADVVSDDLVSEVEKLIAEFDLSPSFLSVEVTERGLVTHPEAAQRVLNALRGLGVRVALDDFGTGYSALAYLKFYPFDILKIDKTFVFDAPDNPKSAGIVRAVMAMAQHFGFRVVAEGVETAAHARWLQESGCHEGQGYFFAKPISAESLADWWRSPPPVDLKE
ncbi:MAG: EAL domain-containing protein [Hydrogenophilus sp.]|nr:EAL domain-containing protein [Hydrogenophilus sp.]